MNRSMQTTVRPLRQLRLLASTAALLLGVVAAPLALAQQTGGNAQPAQLIEQQMTPEQFEAAGLDQLSAGQLANLNAWLNRTLDAETTRAAQQASTQARKQVEDENRGLFGSGSDEPVIARLQGGFDGFAKGREYTLDNGQVWRQIDNATLASVQLDSPQVTIDKSLFGGVWYLKVEGYNTRAKVERVK